MKLGNAKKKNVLPFCKKFRQKLCSKHFNDLTSKKKHVHFPITPRGLSRAGSRPCRLQLRIFESNFLLLFSYLITKPVDAHAAIGAKATQGDLSSITLSVEAPSPLSRSELFYRRAHQVSSVLTLLSICWKDLILS